MIALHLVPKQYFFAKNIIKGWYLAVLALFSNKPTVHTPLHLAVDDKDSSEIMPEISPDLRIHKHKQSLKRGRGPISTKKEKITLIIKIKKQKGENPFHFNSNQTHDKNPL